MSIPTTKPRYTHDSKMDLFLGVYKSVDIYVCFSEYCDDRKDLPHGYYGNTIRYRNFDGIYNGHTYDHLPQIMLHNLMKQEDEPCSLNSETLRLLKDRNLIFYPPTRKENSHCVLFLSNEQILKELEQREHRKFRVNVTKQRTWDDVEVVVARTGDEATALVEKLRDVMKIQTPEVIPHKLSDIFEIFELQPR